MRYGIILAALLVGGGAFADADVPREKSEPAAEPAKPADPVKPADAVEPAKPKPEASAPAKANTLIDADASVTHMAPKVAKELPFHDSIFLFDQSITGETLNPNGQLSYIPSYQWWFSLRPRWYFKPYLSMRVRMDLTTEWLNAVETRLVRQATFGDLWTELVYNPPTRWGIYSSVGFRQVWGTSLEAQAQTSVVRMGPSASVGRIFDTRI